MSSMDISSFSRCPAPSSSFLLALLPVPSVSLLRHVDHNQLSGCVGLCRPQSSWMCPACTPPPICSSLDTMLEEHTVCTFDEAGRTDEALKLER